MPTPRQYATNADRQAAYRARCARRSSAHGPSTPGEPGSRRWAVLLSRARSLLEEVVTEMTTYEAARSEAWHESERGEQFLERLEQIEEGIKLLRELAEA